jgi:hypothetical protein
VFFAFVAAVTPAAQGFAPIPDEEFASPSLSRMITFCEFAVPSFARAVFAAVIAFA